jgi:hypothetical protein
MRLRESPSWWQFILCKSWPPSRPSCSLGVTDLALSPRIVNEVYLNLGNPQAGRLHLESLAVSFRADGQ